MKSKNELKEKLEAMAGKKMGLEDLADEDLESISRSWAFKELDDNTTLKEALAAIKGALNKKK